MDRPGPIPKTVLKQVGDVLSPFMVELFNRSLSEGHFPAAIKDVFITPIMPDGEESKT